ncbi:low specificity L-threonine aldolase [Roseomonas sp. NAR14]|uniref:Low specificity L-threonine aldolase n=1 Tax=Roseomonas acroporae TaxID=2937791 RepID=A0A9X2BW71_9PROT|nr:threonine aldolase family protein [Roseomonas acroporae]MCK8783555.1 low specificity L-threonine aldolase [Roseomonas acroporae]
MVHAPNPPPPGAPPVRINLYSDTQTRPTRGMREAMAMAEVGDEQNGDDPTVNRLQDRMAALLGKEAALFLPSGTMCNVAAVLTHCRPGDEILGHETCHILTSEGGAHGALAGVQITPLRGPRGLFDAEAVRAALRVKRRHSPPQTLLEVEQTANIGGGTIWPLDQLNAVADVAHEAGMATHMDGARLLNATVASGIDAATMAARYDSVWLDFTKGLGAPVGAVLAGSAEFIDAAWRWKQRLGGAMRQAGVIAAACLYALDHHVERLAEDHANARLLAEGLAAIPGVAVERPDTNLVFFDPAGAGMSAADLQSALRLRGILVSGLGGRLRACLHLDVSRAEVEEALGAAREVLGRG